MLKKMAWKIARWKIWILCCLQLFFLGGCVDGSDPENKEYIITMGIDLAEDGYTFTFVPAKTQVADTTLLVATGKTLAEGISLLDQQNPRKTELGQLKMIVLGKEVLLEKGYLHLLEECERSQDISGNVMLLGTEDTAEVCLQAILEGDGETGLFLWDFYENTAEDVAVTWGEDLDGFLSALGEQNNTVLLPKIAVVDGGLSLGGGLLLENHLYVGGLLTEDALGYAFLQGDGKGAILSEEWKGITIPLRIMGTKVSYEVEQLGDVMVCTIGIVGTGDILASGGEDFFAGDERIQLEELFAKVIKEEVTHTIEVAKESNALEALGIGAKIRQKYPDFHMTTDILQLVVETSVDVEDFGRIR